MPEKEFELYLAMLARMLRLNERQRVSVADELRDHLETRLNALMADGKTREQAIQLALEDLGDASGLATNLSTVGALRRRRIIVRSTMISACVLFLGLVATWLFTPMEAPVAPMRVIAQAPQPGTSGAPAAGTTLLPGPMGRPGMAVPSVAARVTPAEQLRRKTEGKLDELCTHDIDFTDIPFRETLEVIGTQMGLVILIDKPKVENASLDVESAVSLRLPTGVATYRTVLDVLLNSVSQDSGLAFEAREGFLNLTSESNSLIVDVYNVRDLIGQPGGYGMPGMVGGMSMSDMDAAGGSGSAMMMGGASMPGMGMPGMPSSRYTRVQFGGAAGGGMGGAPAGMPGGASAAGAAPGGGGGLGGGNASGPVATELGRPLVAMIVEVLEPDAWSMSGGASSIGEVDGLLVVRTTARMHRSLNDLLSKMRAAKVAGPGADPARPDLPGVDGGAGAGGPPAAGAVPGVPRSS